MTLACVVLAVVAIAVSFLGDDLPVEWPGDVLAAAAILLMVLAVGALIEAVFRWVPARARPVVLGVTIIPLLGAAAALGFPESVIHFAGQAQWAFSAANEVSVVPPFVAAAASAAIAAVYRYRLLAVLGVGLLTLVISVSVRDLPLRSLDSQPMWCSDRIDVLADGGVSGEGDGDCTMLLPPQEFDFLSRPVSAAPGP
ncbi:MAG: hypothetical protein JHC84_20000 [Solirubrobacteraceae bacterium]|nr:hypothetical protein [Solirubrobacteraceae bacterium]